MAVDDFVPPIGPSADQPRTEPSVYVSPFGDGYEVARGKGLNVNRIDPMPIVWPALTHAQANTIEAYFRTLEGASFLYTLPGSGTQHRWRLKEWTRDDGNPGSLHANLTAIFREVFEP